MKEFGIVIPFDNLIDMLRTRIDHIPDDCIVTRMYMPDGYKAAIVELHSESFFDHTERFVLVNNAAFPHGDFPYEEEGRVSLWRLMIGAYDGNLNAQAFYEDKLRSEGGDIT